MIEVVHLTKQYGNLLMKLKANLTGDGNEFLSERCWQRVESTAHTALSANECASNNRSCRCTGCATAH